MQFRLITYNIHKGIGGVDRRYVPERVVEALQHYDPDIVFLQEVDHGVPRSRGHRQVDWFGDALQLPYRAFQANVTLRHGYYGNAILSRFPLSRIEHIDLTVPYKKRRRALAAHCRLRTEHHQRTLILYNMHLGLAGYERATQLRRLLRCKSLKRTWRKTSLVVGGDLNDVWGTLGPRFFEPAGLLPTAMPVNTFPAVRPLRPLDRIFYRGRLRCTRSYRGHTLASRYASDHLPLIAEFELD